MFFIIVKICSFGTVEIGDLGYFLQRSFTGTVTSCIIIITLSLEDIRNKKSCRLKTIRLHF